MSSDTSSDPLSRVPDPGSSSFRRVADTTRTRVHARDGEKCWVCGFAEEPGLRVCHNISNATNNTRIKKWKNMRILPVDFFPASMNNLITLCLVCRELYNMAYPKLVILPADLNRFIEFEVQDYQEREEAAKRGVKQQRALPEAIPEGELCQLYMVGEEYARNRDWTKFPKRFSGWPQALILKASAGCFNPFPRVKIGDKDAESVYAGVPDHVMGQVSKLISLWSRIDPEVRPEKKAKPKRKRGEGEDEGESGKEGSGKSQKQTEGHVNTTRKARKGHSGRRSRKSKHEPLEPGVWAVGPEKTSSDLIAEHMMWKKGRGEDIEE